MLSVRAWIGTALVVLALIGAYAVYLSRTRVVSSSRSLSAAHPPANTAAQTHPLHVEGCRDDFVVKIGELVEPRAVPGSTPDQLRATYGKETRREKNGTLVWDTYPDTITGSFGEHSTTTDSVAVSVKQGHVVETLDGLELGIDSMGAVIRKMTDRGFEVHQRIDGGDGHWTLIVSFYSVCGRGFRSEYSKTLSGPELDSQIAAAAGDPRGAAAPLRSDVFLNKVATDYRLVVADGRDQPESGVAAEHR